MRTLRRPSYSKAFEWRWERLSEGERQHVQRVVGELRKAETLPGPGDSYAILPPVIECWRRDVDGTVYAVLYDAHEAHITLYALKRR